MITKFRIDEVEEELRRLKVRMRVANRVEYPALRAQFERAMEDLDALQIQYDMEQARELYRDTRTQDKER